MFYCIGYIVYCLLCNILYVVYNVVQAELFEQHNFSPLGFYYALMQVNNLY